MSERDRYIPGVPCWADTTQPDPEAAVGFYGGLFGWQLEDVMPAGSPAPYFIGRLAGGDVAAITSLAEGAPAVPSWNTYVWVESADEAASKALEAGGRVISEPFDVLDSGRMAVIADPAGAVVSVWQAKEHRGSAVVNEHGSVNFNTLNTPDPEGAKAFYGAVFGWEAVDIGGTDMWALPGYGDHLEMLNPGTREMMADVGAPERFEDVVADIAPIAADDREAPPAHWSIVFAVDDADEIAARAAELGGRVLAPPFDAPWTRMTVIADPQGATFTASKFVPENKDLEGQTDAAVGGS